MDLFAPDQAVEVERLLKLGATRVNWEYGPDADYVVLADPDGIRFVWFRFSILRVEYIFAEFGVCRN